MRPIQQKALPICGSYRLNIQLAVWYFVNGTFLPTESVCCYHSQLGLEL